MREIYLTGFYVIVDIGKPKILFLLFLWQLLKKTQICPSFCPTMNSLKVEPTLSYDESYWGIGVNWWRWMGWCYTLHWCIHIGYIDVYWLYWCISVYIDHIGVNWCILVYWCILKMNGMLCHLIILVSTTVWCWVTSRDKAAVVESISSPDNLSMFKFLFLFFLNFCQTAQRQLVYVSIFLFLSVFLFNFSIFRTMFLLCCQEKVLKLLPFPSVRGTAIPAMTRIFSFLYFCLFFTAPLSELWLVRMDGSASH